MKTVIILGSSRKDGEAMKMVEDLSSLSAWDWIDLNEYSFTYYDYDHKNKNDDFIPLLRTLINKYDTFVFATPVYWYAMSGIMKVFFDRLTDLITIEKDLGRKLRGKHMAAISTSYGNNMGEAFWLPFKASAEYLGMDYLGDLHTFPEEEGKKEMIKFIDKVNRG